MTPQVNDVVVYNDLIEGSIGTIVGIVSVFLYKYLHFNRIKEVEYTLGGGKLEAMSLMMKHY